MSSFYKIADNLGYEILNFLDCDDLYSMNCTNYLNKILEKTKFYNKDYYLKTMWIDLFQVELIGKEEEKYQKYLNSDEFHEEVLRHLYNTPH
tara:strand:+ start:1111 stop:1386 length:276 start_codon:yes stop_codon:yes gene_type:complete